MPNTVFQGRQKILLGWLRHSCSPLVTSLIFMIYQDRLETHLLQLFAHP